MITRKEVSRYNFFGENTLKIPAGNGREQYCFGSMAENDLPRPGVLEAKLLWVRRYNFIFYILNI